MNNVNIDELPSPQPVEFMEYSFKVSNYSRNVYYTSVANGVQTIYIYTSN